MTNNTIRFEENHIHTTYSDGKNSLQEILEYNQQHDKLDLIISDHVDKKTSWFGQYVAEIKKLREQYPDFSVTIGCEVKILEDGTLNTTNDILVAAEVVLGSVHHFEGYNVVDPEEFIKREYELTKLLATNQNIDILAHPFSMCMRVYKGKVQPSREWVEEIYQLCVRNSIKFEYNFKHSPQTLCELAKQEIVQGKINHFSFGSDVHESCEEIGDAAFAISEPINVLVTGVGAGVGQSILKALKLSKVKTKIVAVDSDSLAAGLFRGDVARLIPLASAPDYIDSVIKLCQQEKIKLILVGTDIELSVLALNKELIEKSTNARLIISSYEAITITDNKWKTVEFLKENNFPHPRSCQKDSVEKFLKDNPFPLVVKPQIGARSIGFNIVNNRKELDEKIVLLQDPIIQEYLPQEDQEFTCSAFFWEGKNYGVIAGRRWLRNGDTYKVIFKKDPDLETFIAEVARKLNINGPCNFQLRKTAHGPIIFEINCRFSGTTGAVSHLGFNVPNALLQVLFLGRTLKTLSFREACVLRYWGEVIVDAELPAKLADKQRIDLPISNINVF